MSPSGRRNTGVAVSFAVSRNVQQILIAKGDLRLQVLAKFPQYSLTQDIGIEFAGVCMLDNSFGVSLLIRLLWSPSCRAAQAMSNATAMTRLVSGSNLELSKNA
jgi:hypothetical protein